MTAGKWSFRLLEVATACFAVALVEVIAFHQTGGSSLTDNLWLAIPMLCAGAGMTLAFCVGTFAMWRYRDRSPKTVAATVIGFIVVVFIFGEFLAPH